MFRCALTYLVILGIALSGYQPASAAMLARGAAGMDMQVAAGASPSGDAAMPDCPGMQGQTEKQSLPCEMDGSCAARCHLNTGLEVLSLAPLPAVYALLPLAPASALALTQAPPGPNFRPPIL